MLERRSGRRLMLVAAATLLVACGHPEQRVVDQYFGAINAGDDSTLLSFAAYKFEKKAERWKIVSTGPETTVEAPLPGLVKQAADAQAEHDAKKKDMQRYANEHYNDYEAVKQAQGKGAKVPPNLQEMATRLDEWSKTERELKKRIADARAAADAERRLMKLSTSGDDKDLDSLPADLLTKDLELTLTVNAQEEPWVMHLRRYNPKQSGGPRLISRWVVQAMEPKK